MSKIDIDALTACSEELRQCERRHRYYSVRATNEKIRLQQLREDVELLAKGKSRKWILHTEEAKTSLRERILEMLEKHDGEGLSMRHFRSFFVPEYSVNSIQMTLSRLQREGVIERVSHGVYALPEEEEE